MFPDLFNILEPDQDIVESYKKYKAHINKQFKKTKHYRGASFILEKIKLFSATSNNNYRSHYYWQENIEFALWETLIEVPPSFLEIKMIEETKTQLKNACYQSQGWWSYPQVPFPLTYELFVSLKEWQDIYFKFLQDSKLNNHDIIKKIYQSNKFIESLQPSNLG